MWRLRPSCRLTLPPVLDALGEPLLFVAGNRRRQRCIVLQDVVVAGTIVDGIEGSLQIERNITVIGQQRNGDLRQAICQGPPVDFDVWSFTTPRDECIVVSF